MGGDYEKAAELTRHALEMQPDISLYYENLTIYTTALGRFDETRQIARAAHQRNIDAAGVHWNLYDVAFVSGDSSAMAEELHWFTSRSDYEEQGFGLASDTAAYAGQVGKARELSRQAVNSAIKADDKESAAVGLATFALQQSAYGNPIEARQIAAEALRLSPTAPGAMANAALAYAMTGDTARAQRLADDLAKRYPLGTQMQSLWLPTIHAIVALQPKRFGARSKRVAIQHGGRVGARPIQRQHFLSS